MDDLWKVIGKLAATLHADRTASIADAILRLRTVSEFDRVKHAFGPNADHELMECLHAAWEAAPKVSPAEVAAAFRGAAEVAAFIEGNGSIELVWTGPKTGLIPTRRTEQVILEVIETAKDDVFLVTYVFYKASSIVKALNAAVARCVDVRILLESCVDHGGSVKGDSVRTMSEAVPGATIYVWNPSARKPAGDAASASVHAKCAVADGRLAFITSANLTSAALERNMELGLLIRGGDVPGRLSAHLNALMATRVIRKWTGSG